MSTPEIVDVVDCNDTVSRSATRAEVHAQGLRHRSVHILVFNPVGELYVQKRSRAKDCSPGLWDTSAAGHLASGESYAAAAKRELSEELRVSPHPVLDPVFKLDASPATGFEFVNVFRCVTAGPVIPDLDEITEGRWIGSRSLALWMRRDRAEFTATFHEICARLIWSPLRNLWTAVFCANLPNSVLRVLRMVSAIHGLSGAA